MKQTAVEKMAEWLEAEIGHHVPYEKRLYIQLIISNAKALEKEQMIDFAQMWEDSPLEKYDCKEDLYNETYGGDE
jgi:hypothetical protein